MRGEATALRGYTVREVALLLRVSPRTVRGWIADRALTATDVGSTGRPRLIVLPDDLAAFRAARRPKAAPKPAPRRGRRRTYRFYP